MQAMRKPLGKALESAIMPGDQPEYMPAGLGMQSPQKKQGLFAPGSKGQMIAGIIGDTLASLSGGQPVFTQMLAQQRQQQAEEAQWTRRRMTEREDKQWEWANKPKDAPNPTEFERALEASGVVRGTPQWASAMARKVENTLNPMMAVQTVDANGNPAITYTPRNGAGMQPSGPPQAAIDYLKANPGMKDAFEQKYGAGSASQYIGGPASAPGGFPY